MANERSDTGSAGLAWPPLAEDLKRLYLEERLSASKIAKVYGLGYASPKTAESTILHHLKRHGIARREPAAHVRKVTGAMVDDWMVRYQKGESLKQIAGDAVDPVTVFNHLHKSGLRLRDKVEAQIAAVQKHQRSPFRGDMNEKAYLVGLTVGDLYAQRHGRAVRVRLSTTYPDMAKLFRELFSPSGPLYEYPRENELTGAEWCLDCDLDSTFDFLLNAKERLDSIFKENSLFMSFLAGFFDAEGTIYYHKKKVHGAFEFYIVNTNERLLRRIAGKLSEMGYAVNIFRTRQDPDRALIRGIKNSSEYIWRIAIWRYEDMVRILRALPFRHPEKVEKRNIALKLEYRSEAGDRREILEEWDSLRKRIKRECTEYIALAIGKLAVRNQPQMEIGG